MSPRRESYKQALRQVVDRFIGDMRGSAFKDHLVDEILRVNDRFNSNETLNSEDGSYKP